MAYNWDAVNAAIRAERAKLKWSREELAKRANTSPGTIKNLEGQLDYKRIPVELLRSVDAAFDWPAGTLEAMLDPASPTVDLENRYQRRESVADAGNLVEVVDDMVYRAFMFGRPDAPFEQYDRTRRRVFEVLREAGIDIAERHDGTSSGTGSGA